MGVMCRPGMLTIDRILFTIRYYQNGRLQMCSYEFSLKCPAYIDQEKRLRIRETDIQNAYFNPCIDEELFHMKWDSSIAMRFQNAMDFVKRGIFGVLSGVLLDIETDHGVETPSSGWNIHRELSIGNNQAWIYIIGTQGFTFWSPKIDLFNLINYEEIEGLIPMWKDPADTKCIQQEFDFM